MTGYETPADLTAEADSMLAQGLLEGVEWATGGGFHWVRTDGVLTVRILRELS